MFRIHNQDMKRIYEKPVVEKISFRYRDQVVAASGDGTTTNKPSVGEWTNNPGSSGCSWYLAEEWNLGICGIL